mgnify:CR=1 FL=1
MTTATCPAQADYEQHKANRQQMSDTDAQRKRLSVNPTFWRYSSTDASPLGTDHKAVVLQKVAERNANAAAFQMLSRSITLGDCYKRARQLQHEGDFVAAAAELGQAKLLGADEKRLEQAYNTAAAVHLATMLHLLTVALAESAKRTAQKELAQTFFAPFVSAEAVSTEAKQAPAERQTFTAPTEAPPLANSDAGAAPPVRTTEATEPSRPSHIRHRQGVV